MLERLEDIEDLKMLEEMRKGSLDFKKLDDFLKDYSPDVCGLNRKFSAT